MKRSTKIALIVAGVCLALGMVLCLFGLILVGFDVTGINNHELSHISHEVVEEFDSIRINDIECQVRLFESSNDKTWVECSDSDRIFTRVAVDNGTLSIERIDGRKWYDHIGIWWDHAPTLNVYLPESEYASLYILTVSGDIEIPSGFTFENVEIYSTSGDISSFCEARGDMTVQSTSGDVVIRGVRANTFKTKTTSGDIDISHGSAAELSVITTSGDIELSQITVDGEMSVSSTSGDIEIDDADAAELELSAVSGDIEAVLLSAKKFVTDTVSGSISVPASDDDAGICSVSTTSGDVRIIIAKK